VWTTLIVYSWRHVVASTKRINFDVTPEQEEELAWLRAALGSATTKDTLLRAVRVLGVLSRERSRGAHIYVRTADGETARLVLPELESPEPVWKWLTGRAHPWRRQMWIKGRRLMASAVWRSMVANEMSEEEAAEDWGLPLEAIREAVAWSEANRQLIAAEAVEEKRWLREHGVAVEPSHPG